MQLFTIRQFCSNSLNTVELNQACFTAPQVQDIVREYSHRFCKDLVRPLQLARVTVALYPSVGDVVSISAHLGACVRVARA